MKKSQATRFVLSALMAGWMSAQIVSPVLPLQAAEPDQQVSITLAPGQSGSLKGRTFRFYRVFEISAAKDGSSYHYRFARENSASVQKVFAKPLNIVPSTVTPELCIDYITSITEGAPGSMQTPVSAYRYLIEDLKNELKTSGSAALSRTVNDVDADGNCTVSGLEPGYYLVDEVRSSSQQSGAASLCLAAHADSAQTIVMKGDYPQLTKQIHEDDGNIGWNDIGDYEIGQNIPYRYASSVPQISGYKSYYYAFHDQMDPVLSFLPDSLKVTISDGKKTYILSPQDYGLKTGENGETFTLTISDLKELVDREFYEGDANAEHPYGQSVAVEYSARLSEQAIGKEGRPGFENAARLEFSNDPDSDGEGRRGFTPWDTVVAFTYRVDGDKINEKNVPLEGAKFRLYRDEACTSEVRLKKSGSVYSVIHEDQASSETSAPAEIISDAGGDFAVSGLDQGDYWLKEVEAPDGYRPLAKPVKLTVVPTFTPDRNSYEAGLSAGDTILQKLDASAEISQIRQGSLSSTKQDLAGDPQNGSISLQIVNQTGLRLPLTGSNATALLLGAGTLCAAGGSFGYSRHRKNRKLTDQ